MLRDALAAVDGGSAQLRDIVQIVEAGLPEAPPEAARRQAPDKP
jgi:hypothetical protein